MSEARMNLHAMIMNIRAVKTLSHFIKVSEYEAYLLGHKQARHDAAEIASSVSAQIKAADAIFEAFCSKPFSADKIHLAVDEYRKAKEQAQ